MTASGSVLAKPPSRPVSFIEPIVEEEEEEEVAAVGDLIASLSPVVVSSVARGIGNTGYTGSSATATSNNSAGGSNGRAHVAAVKARLVTNTTAATVIAATHSSDSMEDVSETGQIGGFPQQPHQQPTPPSSSAAYPLTPSISSTIAAVASGMTLSNDRPTVTSVATAVPARPAPTVSTIAPQRAMSNGVAVGASPGSPNKSIGFGRGFGQHQHSNSSGTGHGHATGFRGFGGFGAYAGLGTKAFTGTTMNYSGNPTTIPTTTATNNHNNHTSSSTVVSGAAGNGSNSSIGFGLRPFTSTSTTSTASSTNTATAGALFTREAPHIPRELSAAASQYFSGSGPGNGSNSFRFLNHIQSASTANSNSTGNTGSKPAPINTMVHDNSRTFSATGINLSSLLRPVPAAVTVKPPLPPQQQQQPQQQPTPPAPAPAQPLKVDLLEEVISAEMTGHQVDVIEEEPEEEDSVEGSKPFITTLVNGTTHYNGVSIGQPMQVPPLAKSAEHGQTAMNGTAGSHAKVLTLAETALPKAMTVDIGASTTASVVTNLKIGGMTTPTPPTPLALSLVPQTERDHASNGTARPPKTPVSPGWLRQTCQLTDLSLLDTLGTGSFGRVFLARAKPGTQLQLCGEHQFYAMKVLKKTEVVRLKQVEHINSEKEILTHVHHPFIVNLYATFQDTVNLYMLMEYVIGGEVFSHLRRAGRFTNEMTKFYAAEIVLAIEYLHSKDIIYRDLKPENLLLDHRGHVKITDFGFAKKVDERTWTLCGTPEYLAPEIIQSKGHGKPVDWWALGILIFEMLAGYPPFFDDNPFGIYERILVGRIQFPGHFDPAARDIVKRLLTADRTKRLGNLHGGAEDVRRHDWFRGVDWEALLRREVLAPLVPNCRHPGDTSNFERYPEQPHEVPDPNAPDPFRHLFRDF